MKNRVLVTCFLALSVLAFGGVLENAAAKDKDVRILKFQTLYSEGREPYEWVKYFTSEVEKRTDGRIKFRIFPGSSLVPTKQMVSSVHKGILDAAFAVPTYEQGLWPITGVIGIFGAPKINYKDWRTVHDQVRDIMNKNIDLNLEIVGMPHVLSYILYSRKPLTGKVQDFDGLLIRSAGGPFNAAIKALGGAPVKMPAPETYMALQKGTLDGALTAPTRYISGKGYEVAPHVMIIPKGLMLCAQFFVVNKSVWDSFSPDIRKVFLEVGTEVVSFANDRNAALENKIVTETIPKLGIQPVIMSEAENEILTQKIKPVWGEYISKLGEPAKEIAAIVGVKQ